MELLLWTLCVAFVLVGLIGTIVPLLPGTPMIFLGLLLGAWTDDFQKVGWFTLSILGILTALTFVVDFIATKIGVEKAGASSLATIGAFVGAIVGLFFGFMGVFVFPFLGAAIGEYLVKKDLIQAGKVGLGTWLGMVISIAVKTSVNFAMLGIFVLAYFLG